jgi:hypothetical protein
VQKLVDAVHAPPQLWRETAIFVTFEKAGGKYDSGYIQPFDFFGDGARPVLLAISPNAKPGFVDHDCADHVSLLKFIEANSHLPPVTSLGRDNLLIRRRRSQRALLPHQRAGDKGTDVDVRLRSPTAGRCVRRDDVLEPNPASLPTPQAPG